MVRHRHTARLVALAVLLATVAGVGIGVGTTPAAAATPGSCTTTAVTYDVFRTDEATVSELANGSSVSATNSNTRVTIDETEAFYKLTAENPNGYCVHYTVEVAAEAMDPAKIPGAVESNGGNHTASWDARHDFDTDETYTVIKFSLPAGETATFAPNAYRVKALSWASEKTTEAESVWTRLKSRFSDTDVAKRHYRITVDHASTVDVPLRNPQTEEKVQDYYLMFTTDGETWRPVPADTDAPVFKETVDDGRTVRLTFRDPDAEVKFVADPSPWDKAKREAASYKAGAADIVDRLFGGLGGGD